MATKTKATKITRVKKTEIYQTRSGQLIEVTNGRLKDEGEQGVSFTGRTIEFNLETGRANRSKTNDHFYLDELTSKLSQKDYDEWLEVGRREAEALADACNGSVEPAPQQEQPSAPKKPSTKNAKPKPASKPTGKLSLLDAAHQILQQAGEPLNAKAIIEAAATQQLWISPGGKTPHNTLYAAMLREITTKGNEARFEKADKGLFRSRG